MNQVGAARDTVCPNCGEPVLEFDVDIFTWSIRLQGNDLPITADLQQLAREFRVWEDHGPRLGWTQKYTAERSWRPIRATHICVDSPFIPIRNGDLIDRARHEHGKQKNKKETHP